jgi:hypothetical protein
MDNRSEFLEKEMNYCFKISEESKITTGSKDLM